METIVKINSECYTHKSKLIIENYVIENEVDNHIQLSIIDSEGNSMSVVVKEFHLSCAMEKVT